MKRERDVGCISWKEMQGVYHVKRCRGCIMERDVGGVIQVYHGKRFRGSIMERDVGGVSWKER